jgi:hypothetical protein
MHPVSKGILRQIADKGDILENKMPSIVPNRNSGNLNIGKYIENKSRSFGDSSLNPSILLNDSATVGPKYHPTNAPIWDNA